MGKKFSGVNERCKWLRETIGFGQKELARNIGVSSQTISNIENNRGEASEVVRRGYARVFDANIHWIETGEGNAFLDDKTQARNEDEKNILQSMRKIPRPIVRIVARAFEEIAEISSGCAQFDEVSQSSEPMFAKEDEF